MIHLHLSRALPVPPERVWQALTDPSALAAWFWPATSFGTTAEIDPRPGGRTLDPVHDRFTDQASRDDNARGRSDCLDRLPAFLTEKAPHGR